jgi:hypothetical protein
MVQIDETRDLEGKDEDAMDGASIETRPAAELRPAELWV